MPSEYVPEIKLEQPLVSNSENETIMHPRLLGQSARESFTDYANPRGKEVALYPGENLQDALDNLNLIGGGTLLLRSGIHLPIGSLVMYDNITISGSPGSIIDFNGAATGIVAIGSDVYTTGTISVNNDSFTVTGSGTSFTSSMEGQSILIGEFWYPILTVGSTTSITLGSNYIGSNVSGATFIIATPISNVILENFTIQNSTDIAVSIQYANGVSLDGVYIYGCTTGIQSLDSAYVQFLNGTVDTCTNGILMSNCRYGTYFNQNLLNGGGIVANGMSNFGFEIFSFQNISTTGIAMRNSNNNGFVDFSMQEITGAAYEFVSGNSDTQISDGSINKCSTDGIRLTNNSDKIIMSSNTIHDNTGYGINIVESTSENNVIIGNTFTNNTAGNVNNAGTGTRTSSNQGVADDSDVKIIDVNVLMTPASNVNWTSKTGGATTNAIFGQLDSSGAQNDEISFDVTIPFGTWTFELMHTQTTNRGIYTVTFNGVSVGTIDGYSAVTTFNVLSQITGISITSSGSQTIKLKMATKNPSSGTYFGSIQWIQLRRTA